MPTKVWRTRDLGGISVVSEPSSNYLEILGDQRKLTSRRGQEPKRAIAKAVTSPEDRLGETCWFQHGISVVNYNSEIF